MPAHHARRRPLVVANARHSPSYGCALCLDRTSSDALLGHDREKLSTSEPKTRKTEPAQPQHASPTAQDPSPLESPLVLPPPPDKYQPKPDDSKAVADWRKRMATDEAKEIYKQRAATAECVNAQVRNRGLQQMPVRGLERVRSVVGLHVLAHNLLCIHAIAPHLIGRARPAPS